MIPLIGIIADVRLAARTAGRFLKSVPWQLWCVIAAVLLILVGGHYHARAAKQAYDAAYAAGAADTKKAFADAQKAVDDAARRRIAATVLSQDHISQETVDAYHQAFDSIDARARAIGMQHDEALARDRAAIAGAVSAAGQAPGCPQQAPAQDGLPWGVALPLMTQAQKNLAQLNAVLDFEAAQDALASDQEASASE